ncbi:hypothetical protein P7K49_002688, partial [Saguinus oedipus]
EELIRSPVRLAYVLEGPNGVPLLKVLTSVEHERHAPDREGPMALEEATMEKTYSMCSTSLGNSCTRPVALKPP